MRTALVGTGAITAEAQHAHTPAKPKAVAPAKAWQPLLFDAHQSATVVALTDLIIPATDTPGAKEARVVEYIDLILNDGAAERRNDFLQGLGWLDGYAIRVHGKPFVQCASDQQVSVLKALDKGATPELKSGAAFFAEVKRLTVSGYYTTRIGIDELNKGGRVPATFACRKNDH
jgi:hypothetical protein